MIYDMIWYDMIWYDMIWYVIWYDIWHIWYDMVRYDMIWYMIWYGTIRYDIWYDMICLTAIGLTAGGSSTVHIYTQTIHRTTQLSNLEECGPCPVFASYTCTMAFALQLRKKHGKTSVRVDEECRLTRWKQNMKKAAYITLQTAITHTCRLHNFTSSWAR